MGESVVDFRETDSKKLTEIAQSVDSKRVLSNSFLSDCLMNI
jgi:hypothetical protein